MSKKIINGKRYDTETAELMGCAGYSNRFDSYFWNEELYRKKTGEFFLLGEGGPNSRYGKRIAQNEWSGSWQIRPLTMEQAKEWAEKHLDGDRYEEIFGPVEEEDKTQISMWIPDGAKADADQLREKGYTLANIFVAGIRFLKQDET